MSKIHPLKVVGRGGETQVQVGENLNSLTKGQTNVSHWSHCSHMYNRQIRQLKKNK